MPFQLICVANGRETDTINACSAPIARTSPPAVICVAPHAPAFSCIFQTACLNRYILRCSLVLTAKASLRTDLQSLALSATPHPSSPYGRTGRTEVHDHRHARAQGGPDHDLDHSSGGESDCKLEIRFPPPPPSQQSQSRASGFGGAAAAASCSSVVRRDYSGGVKDVGQLVRRVEASTRAVSREKEHIAKVRCLVPPKRDC